VPEIERKFTVEMVPEQLLGPGSAIRQGYLSVEPVEVRVRSRDGAHELTVKSLGGLRRAEVNVPLTSDQFDELWPLVTAVIEKTRHLVELGGALGEVDIFGGKLVGLVVAEVEFPPSRKLATSLRRSGSAERCQRTAVSAMPRWHVRKRRPNRSSHHPSRMSTQGRGRETMGTPGSECPARIP